MPQGTIKTFDIEARSGTLVLDDQTEYFYDADTFLASRLEELRIGQRVRFELEDGDVRRLDIVSL
jgi:cold shock CspA family protein